ncbi:MAG: hypothetical protein ABSG46_02625 [Candidatus Binataceae bacterium]|jgi:hypothetical protein
MKGSVVYNSRGKHVIMTGMPDRSPTRPIYAQVIDFIKDPRPGAFETLALEVFQYQFENVPAYREFCLSKGATPASVREFQAIPIASTLAFKYACISNEADSDSASPLTFRTSGTTKGFTARGMHRVPYPQVYRASAIAHLLRMLFPDNSRMPILALHPTADRMRESSLSWMLSWCIEEFGSESSLCVANQQAVDIPAAAAFLKEIERSEVPACILGTTASFARLFDYLAPNPLVLPRGSRLMDTGGAKGQATPLTAAEVIAHAGRLMAVEPSMVINEYGMTELCSQLYDATPFNCAIADDSAVMRMKLPPPWLRPLALDPVTLQPVPDGQAGMLAFFDLANVGSISALMTEDFGFIRDGAVGVIGRAAASDPRGCALAIEQFARFTDEPRS